MGKNKRKVDDSENKLFLHILKIAIDGGMWKIIKQGTSKQECHDVWVATVRIFSREAGTEITWQQAKSKASNVAEYQEKANKAHTHIEFRKLCQKTGSGPAPSQPPLEDAEDDNGFNLDMLHDTEPIETPLNELVHPQDAMISRAGGSVPSSSSCTSSGQYPRDYTRQSQTTKFYPYASRQSTPSSCPSQTFGRFLPENVPSMAGIVAGCVQ